MMNAGTNRNGEMNRSDAHSFIVTAPDHPFARYMNGRKHEPAAGRIEYSVNHRSPGNGMTLRVIRLTLVDEVDEEVLRRKGLAFLRRMRIYRLTNEAERQGCPLTYGDLHDLLLVSVSTLKRDIAVMRREGLRIPLKRSMEKKETNDETEQDEA